MASSESSPEGLFNPEVIPLALRECPQWVAWRYEDNGDAKPGKVPINPHTGGRASSVDPGTWGTFEAAVSAWIRDDGLAGLGFVFAADDPFCGIDLDECIGEDGQIAPSALEIIKLLDSYSEVSPSGRGAKVIIRGHKPGFARCKSKAIAGFKESEVYDQGRFFTVTGQHLEGTPRTVEDRQEDLNALCERLWPPKPSVPAEPHPRSWSRPGAMSIRQKSPTFWGGDSWSHRRRKRARF